MLKEKIAFKKHPHAKELKNICGGHLPFPYAEKGYAKFDCRNTFNFDVSLIAYLYENLRYFEDEAAKIVDFEAIDVEIDNETLTCLDCIHRMAYDCIEILEALHDDVKEDYGKADKYMKDLFKVLAACYWYLWW